MPPSEHARRLPPLDQSQGRIVKSCAQNHVVFRGSPGAGKTTTLLHVIKEAVAAGQSFAVLVPDRARADRLARPVQALAPEASRPVKTAVGFAYSVIDRWRTYRADPLGGVELLTGAQEDALVGEMLTRLNLEQMQPYMGTGEPRGMLKMELRNLLSTADRWGVGPGELIALSEHFSFPLWQPAARVLFELDADIHAEKRGQLRLRHSQVERMAADLLENWESNAAEAQVTADLPLPDLICVDGMQDMTASTIRLLEAMAACGARLVIASEPDAAVATYRGAIPQADLLIAHSLDVPIVELDGVYRGTEQIRHAIRRVSESITVAGPSTRRRAHLTLPAPLTSPDEAPSLEEGPSPEGGADTPHLAEAPAAPPSHGGTSPTGENQLALPPASIHLKAAHTDAQMGAHIARILRENYLFYGRSWANQVVIVRSRSIAQQVRRHLRRASVPINTSTRAFEFMSEPTTRLLIHLIVDATPDGQGDPLSAMNALVSSAFIGVDPVDLHRLLRCYGGVIARDNELDQAQALPLEDALLRLYLDPIDKAAGQTLNAQTQEDCTKHPELARFTPILEKLTTAAGVWQAARTYGTQRPRQALWSLWEAAGVADAWQQRAISTAPDSYWFDEQLDAIVALFRVADVWEQRNPAGVASAFAAHIRNHDLPIDTLLPAPHRPDAVSVLTPAEAAGGQWPVVIIAGAQHERWPNVVLRNQMLHADTLAELKLWQATGADDPTWADLTHIRQQRRRVKDDEYRMFVCALGAATEELHLAVVSNEGSAPSELIDRTLGSRPGDRVEGIARDEDGTARYPVTPAPSPLDSAGVIGDLRYWACIPTRDTAPSAAHISADASTPLDSSASPESTQASASLPGGASSQVHDRKQTARRALAMLSVEGIRGAHPREWGTPGALSSDQPLLGGQKPSISPSAVEKIETCPLLWFASKMGAESTPGHSAATRGTFIHALAEVYHYDRSIPIRTLFEQRWPEYSAGLDALDLARERQKLEDCVNGLEAYFAHVPPEVEDLTQVELFIRQDMGDFWITGLIDRLEPDGDGVKIVDFKTGAPKKPEEALVDPQLQTYQVALRAQGAKVTGAQLQYVREKDKGGRNPAPAHINGMRIQNPLTPEEHADRLDKFTQDIATMNAPHFQAIIGPKCTYCSVAAICPAQQGNDGGANV